MNRPLVGAAASALACVSLLGASAQSSIPPRRAHHAMAYDEASRRVIMTGGSTPIDSGRGFTFFNDLWAFDGVRWTRIGESGEKMSGIGLAFDRPRNRMLSFGGFYGSSGAPAGELRVLEGADWRVIGRHPSVQAAEPGVVYDARRDRLVTFGGSAGQRQVNGEAWEFDGFKWAQADSPSPPPRQAFAMAYDERRGVTVVFGGMGVAPPGQRPPALGDTWEYDGRTWTARQAPGPPPRFSPGVAYDSRRGLVIVFGGMGPEGALGDTWSWDGSEWRKLSDAGPSPRAMGYMAYDKARDRIVLFGGRTGWPNGDHDDTWEWDGSAWSRVAQ